MTRRRIELVAPPFSGHLHPILAMGRVLAAEHDVRVLSLPEVAGQVHAAGLVPEAMLAGEAHALAAIASPRVPIGGNPLRLQRQFAAALRLLGRAHEELGARWRAQRPDLVVADFTLPVVGPVADTLGVPWWTSMPSPCVIECTDGPPAYFGGLPPARGPWHATAHAVRRRLVRVFKRAVFALHRRTLRRMGLVRLYRDDASEAAYSRERILALTLRELEFAQQWPAAVRFVGPMSFTPPSDHPEPPFRPQRRHVLATLGTHLGRHKDAFAARVQEVAAALPDVEFHFTDGEVMQRPAVRTRAGNFTRVPFVDYGRWLPHYDIVIHHGGAGVMHACLAAGRPAVVCPIDYDQFDHAARLAHHGVARWLRRPQRLVEAVRDTLDDAGMLARCRTWAARLAALDGAAMLRALVRERLG